MARPMPRDPPVTSAVLLSRLPMALACHARPAAPDHDHLVAVPGAQAYPAGGPRPSLRGLFPLRRTADGRAAWTGWSAEWPRADPAKEIRCEDPEEPWVLRPWRSPSAWG